MSVCKKCLSEEVCRYNDGINLYCKDDYDCPHFKNKADFVEVEVLRDWLWETALNNVGGDFSIACQDIISRLDGLRNFAKERKK